MVSKHKKSVKKHKDKKSKLSGNKYNDVPKDELMQVLDLETLDDLESEDIATIDTEADLKPKKGSKSVTADTKSEDNIKNKGTKKKKARKKEKKEVEEVDEEEKPKKGKRKKGKHKRSAKAKVKAKGKGKPKPPKRPTVARKIPLTGTARKLPIEEVDESVDIDWSFERPTEEDEAVTNFKIAQMEDKLKHIEREKMNLENELFHMKPDLIQKTKIITELKNDYERLRDDFDKYKKRIRTEMKENQKQASEKLITELLEVLDNFERTNKLDISTAGKKDILKGVQMIEKQILDILDKAGLKIIKAAGEPFDPNVHEAIAIVETDEHPNNTVLEELLKGYKLRNKVIRAAQVRVSQSDIRPGVPIKAAEKKKPKKKKEEKKVKSKKKPEPKPELKKKPKEHKKKSAKKKIKLEKLPKKVSKPLPKKEVIRPEEEIKKSKMKDKKIKKKSIAKKPRKDKKLKRKNNENA